MANSLSASFIEVWAKEQQSVFYKENVARMIADTSFEKDLSEGDTLNRTYRSSSRPQSYTRGTAITIDDLTDTNEALTINKQFAYGFYVDDFDKVQNHYDAAANYGRDHGMYLSNQVDSDILGEVSNATSAIDAADVSGGTALLPFSLTTSNVLSVFGIARQKLSKQNVPMNRLYAVISPEFENVLTQYGAGRDTTKADSIESNGFIRNFYGFDLYRSNQLASTAVLSMATQPNDGDTVVINSVTFTFKTSLGTTAGQVLIGGSADQARVNLTALINAPATSTSNGYALATQNARLFANQISAVNDSGADTMTVTAKGVGVLVVSSVLQSVDAWTSTKSTQHCLFGAGSAPTLVMQADAMNPKVKEVSDKLGRNILGGVLYGVKTYADQAKKMVNVKVASSSFSA